MKSANVIPVISVKEFMFISILSVPVSAPSDKNRGAISERIPKKANESKLKFNIRFR